MRLGFKVLIPQLVLLALLVAASGLLFMDLERQQQALRFSRQQLQAASRFAQYLNGLYHSMMQETLSYRVDRKTRRLDAIAAMEKEIGRTIDAYAPAITDSHERQLLSAVYEARERVTSSRSDFLKIIDAGTEAQIQAAFDRWRIHRNLLTANVDDLAAFNLNRFSDAVAQMEAERLEIVHNGLYGVAVSIVVIVVGFLYVVRTMSGPLARFAQGIEAFGRGRLDFRIDRLMEERADEIGALARAFNRMADQLAEINSTLERRVQERTAQLEAANKELEAFSYSVSHDLRAPLRAIDGFGQRLILGTREKLDEKAVHYLDRIRAGTQVMGQLIEDLLNLSRISRAKVERQRVSLTSMAERIAEELRQTEPGRSAEFSIGAGLSVNGDPRLLEIALQNLLGNACKFSAKQQRPRIELGAMRQDGDTVYFVRDNGAGFDMAYADKLFAPFQRLHSASEFPGTGIGLVTTRRILQKHGGRIWGEGAVDHGATFYFTLAEGEGHEDATDLGG